MRPEHEVRLEDVPSDITFSNRKGGTTFVKNGEVMDDLIGMKIADRCVTYRSPGVSVWVGSLTWPEVVATDKPWAVSIALPGDEDEKSAYLAFDDRASAMFFSKDRSNGNLHWEDEDGEWAIGDVQEGGIYQGIEVDSGSQERARRAQALYELSSDPSVEKVEGFPVQTEVL